MSDAGSPPNRWLSALINVVGCAAVIAGTYAGIRWIYDSQPTAQQQNFKRKSAALVETIRAERRTWSPRLTVLGTVRPAQDIVLSSRVRGQVLELTDSFAPGQIVTPSELLLRIDPADFENVVSIRQSELKQVEASLQIEKGREKLAEQELALLSKTIANVDVDLVLRKPQANSLKSQLSAAQAAVERAQLDLARTEIVAPFHAQVLRRNVNVGSQVQSGDDLAQLVGVEEYWVMAAVPARNLRRIEFEQDGQSGSEVTLHDPESWGPDVSRTARVSRMLGSLDEQTRLARVLVTVPDPLGLKSRQAPLILNSIIEVRIKGSPIPDVVRIPREYVHDRDTVWVMADGKLDIRETEIAFRDAEYAYIESGVEDGDEVVTTTLATVANGVLLRKIAPEQPAQPTDVREDDPADDADTTDSDRSEVLPSGDRSGSESSSPAIVVPETTP
ncbi:MAG: efflux RND transporter periplasmic adaptor subunit [Planctomycetaceae bacterium]|nr:efflux RND transporter periplasmic adaptor subunit [Planctomycetaceae bacterium]